MSENIYLTQKNAVFKKTAGGFLDLAFDGKDYEKVSVRRCFPFTDPDEYFSVREGNEKAEEIGIILKLSDFDKQTSNELLSQMELRYFTPVITKINNIKEEYGYGYFDVTTDKGQVRFAIHMNGNAIARLSDKRIIVTDIDGNRFEIPDIYAFPQAEQRKLDLYI